MIEITLTTPASFLRVKETLTRMGIANQRDKVLYQSCHILKKRHPVTGEDAYYIAHFKNMMALDGKLVSITEEDELRTFSIAKTLEQWGLVKVVQEYPGVEVANNFRVIKAAQKPEWDLRSKYVVGK